MKYFKLFFCLIPFIFTPSHANSAKDNFNWSSASIYFTYVDRFYNGDTSNDVNYGRINDYGNELQNVATFHGGDIKGVTKKLEQGYFRSLGVDVIWITGMYEQIHGWVGGGDKNDFPHYGYHGYYPMDFTTLDKNFGTVEEFRTFVNLAHKQSIRVLMDAGLNHPGYHTLLDAVQYQFGDVDLTTQQAAKHTPGLLSGNNVHYEKYAYLKHFDKNHHSTWPNWWGKDWIRTKQEIDKDVLTESIFGLPDFRTEKTTPVYLPPLLINKWQLEDKTFEPWIVPAAKKYRTNLAIPPAQYLIKWLASWVEEFGIDGFRLDVLDNVDLKRWEQLHHATNKALAKWRKNNSHLQASKWTEDFWMTGDIWDAGIELYPQYQFAGLNSIVNFTFPKSGDLSTIGQVWQKYANELHNQDNWTTLSFLNNTYKRDTSDNNMIAAGTTLLLAPGAIQIFYGDEVGRKRTVQYASDKSHGYRSDMIWNQGQETLMHWQKLGLFRKAHQAVGTGKQLSIEPNTFIRQLTNKQQDDWVLIQLTESEKSTINLSGIIKNGQQLRNAYTGEIQTVSDGLVSFAVENNLLILEKI